jgi:dipeptidyl aminopeptidase/acylaminoacyl peptidase
MLFCANFHTRVYAWILGLDGSLRRLQLGDLDPGCDTYQDSTFDAGIQASIARTSAIVFIASGPHSAQELYYVASPVAKPRRLTHFNDFLLHMQLGVQREIRWRSPDGFSQGGVVTFPPQIKKGRKYPIVVQIHGGPGGAALQDFSWQSWPRTQLMAARGFIVFEPNYRGSDDNGNAFMLALYRDTVRGPSKDILSGLHAVEALPQADSSRVAVCGFSYGGLLTSWLITQYHFWKAAVSGSAVDDEAIEYATSTSNVQNAYYLGTSPNARGGAKIYADESPITYASQVSTPTLFWGDTGDPIVPVSQQYAFFHAVREHYPHVRFAVFPANSHIPDSPQQLAALSRIWLDWLDRYLK